MKILDFGIAKLIGEAQEATNLTTADDLLGSPAYMSPEQMRSPLEVGARTDLWSLGVVLYELLSGAHGVPHSREARRRRAFLRRAR